MPTIFIYIWIIIAVATFFHLRQQARGQKIENPRLGFLDLTTGKSDGIIEEDRAVLADLFSSVETSSNAVPRCDVLFLYATLGADESIIGTDRFLRSTIRESGAKIVVVASENPDPKPRKPEQTEARANLVITLQRNGDKFAKFIRELFIRMKQGQTMPMAWVKIIPQGPSPKHDDCPGTIFLMEVGPIRFG